MKPPATPPSGTRGPDDRGWRVELASRAANTIAKFGYDDPNFNPTIARLIAALESNPYQFPKKQGKLKNYRAAPLTYRGKAWRAVYVIFKEERRVRILTIESHDDAYKRAKRLK